LLEKNTLLGVVTFPEDLFYPIGVLTVGLFIKKGIPTYTNPKSSLDARPKRWIAKK